MNLSWDFAASNPVTASERMNVFFANGDVAFLNSVLCSQAHRLERGHVAAIRFHRVQDQL